MVGGVGWGYLAENQCKVVGYMVGIFDTAFMAIS
jgi:hypothetical protein